ncbi:MAG: hypothetical protein M1820_002466 [Bogoriella megaspora]|nr:MAG: hypothetical protein M1820_002466 [Bogoriella megaspora]
MTGNSPKHDARPARVDDYNSEDSEEVPNTSKSANVASKRAPHTLHSAKVPTTAAPEDASDSGYSSKTAATMNSADSAKELQGETVAPKKEGKKVVLKETQSPRRSRPATIIEPRKSSKDTAARPQKSPTKALSRSASQNKRSSREQCTGCNDPNCPDVLKSSLKQPSMRKADPVENKVDIDYPPPNQAQSRRTSQYYETHPSRYEDYYSRPSREAVSMTPAHSRPRARSTSRARPQSHYDVPPEAYYGDYRSYRSERGPPPSLSAWTNLPQPYPYPGSTPPSSVFAPAVQLHPSPSSRRPLLTHTTTDPAYSTRSSRPSSMYGSAGPLVTYGPSDMSTGPSARRADPVSQQSRPRDVEFYSDSEDDDDDDEAVFEPIDTSLMPPPSAFPKRQSSLRRQTISAPRSYDASPIERPDPFYDQPPVTTTTTTIRRQSSTRAQRPPPAPSVGSKANSYSNASGSARIYPESSNTQRRRSIYTENEPQAQVQQRSYEAEKRASTYAAAERYQAETSGSVDPTGYFQDSARSAATTTIRAPPALGSSQQQQQQQQGQQQQKETQQLPRPSRAPSAAGSGRSVSSRTSFAAEGSIRLKVNTSQGLELSGDMEGRTINLMPMGRDGVAELVIGGREGSVYGGGGSRAGARSRVATEGGRGRRESSVRRRGERERGVEGGNWI